MFIKYIHKFTHKFKHEFKHEFINILSKRYFNSQNNLNKSFYLKYLKYPAVEIDTLYIGENKRNIILEDVSDLISAAVSKPTGSLLGLPKDVGPLSLHSFEGEALRPGVSLAEITTGQSYDTPLVLKSLNEAQMQKPLNADSFFKKEIIQPDNIEIRSSYLKRPELIKTLTKLVVEHRFVRLTSPAASGKSSLLKIFQHSLKNTDVFFISCLTEKSCFELLIEKGIDLEKCEYKNKIGVRDTIIFLDDAQEKYSEVRFWQQLMKVGPNWFPYNLRFIISSTHLVSIGTSSPVVLETLPKLDRNDFLLSANEAKEFLELPFIGLPEKMQYETVREVIIRDCGGIIGALRLSVDSLKERFAKDPKPSDSAVLQHFLSNDLLYAMGRCFGNSHSAPIGIDFKNVLKRIMVDEKQSLYSLENQQDNESYSSLKKAGILVELADKTFRFSSSLAKRYYFKWIFPNRPLDLPATLPGLIENVISSMSATILKNSTMPGDFPKEATFQHLFMEGLALFIPAYCSICPELSKIFPGNTKLNSQTRIAGEIDFYLNSSLRWGIELLVNGNSIEDHTSRFSPPNGKYVSLAVSDFIVVDFRRNSTGMPTNILKHSNRITVFFKNEDYSIAQCIFGLNSDPVAVNLSN